MRAGSPPASRIGRPAEIASNRDRGSAWARIWRGKQRNDYAVQLLAIDPHSPAEFRCNGVLANFDEFADHYELSPGDALWISPEDRVKIW